MDLTVASELGLIENASLYATVCLAIVSFAILSHIYLSGLVECSDGRRSRSMDCYACVRHAPAIRRLCACHQCRVGEKKKKRKLASVLGELSLIGRDFRLRSKVLIAQSDAIMHLPAQIGDYTDFYASRV